MKVIVKQSFIAAALARVIHTTGSSNTMPILQNVRLVAGTTAGGLEITATNLDRSVTVELAAEVKEAGEITLPGKRLDAIVKSFSSSSSVTIESLGGGRIGCKVAAGAASFNLIGLEASKWPLATVNDQGAQAITIKQHDLADMLERVQFAQSTDANRFVLNGVFFDIARSAMILVATDGRRLAKCQTLLGGDLEPQSFILPAKAVADLGRLLNEHGDVILRVGANTSDQSVKVVSWRVDVPEKASGILGMTFVSKVVEGNYPNWRQVIPKTEGTRFKVERIRFAAAVDRAMVMTDERNNTMKLCLAGDSLEVSAACPAGTSLETIVVETNNAPKKECRFNPTYFAEILGSSDVEAFTLEIIDDASPASLREDRLDTHHIVMPQRLS